MEGLRQKTGITYINLDDFRWAVERKSFNLKRLLFMFGKEDMMTHGDPNRFRRNCLLGSQHFHSNYSSYQFSVFGVRMEVCQLSVYRFYLIIR